MHFDHIAISTTNIRASIGYYVSSFSGTEVLYEDETWALLQCPGIKIALVHPDEHPEHLCFVVESREELEIEATRNSAAITKHRDDSESFYMLDPNGNTIEILFYPRKAVV